MMDEFRKLLNEIINIDYRSSLFDSVRAFITDNMDLMPTPFIGQAEDAIVATVTICSHSKEYHDSYPVIFRKTSDDYINLKNNFDEQMYCPFFAYIETMLNDIKASYYSKIANERNFIFSCHLNIIPFSIKGKWNDLLFTQRKELYELHKGKFKELLSKSKLNCIFVFGIDAIRYIQNEFNAKIETIEVDNKYDIERYYISSDICKNRFNEPIKMISSPKIGLSNRDMMVRLYLNK